MTLSCSIRDVLFLAAVFALSSVGAKAENWQDTRHTTLIDVDSIHKESDGLVYFMEKNKYHDEENGQTRPARPPSIASDVCPTRPIRSNTKAIGAPKASL